MSQKYSLKGKDGASVSLTLIPLEPGPMPPENLVQTWFSKHHYPKRGSIAVDGFAQCQTPRKAYQLRGRGGKAVAMSLDIIGDGEFPAQEELQKWYVSKNYPESGSVDVPGAAPCVIVS